MFLTDHQWTLLHHLFPPSPPSRGRPLVPDQLILDAVLWKLSTNTHWDLLPAGTPSRETCYRRYRQWTRSGLLNQVYRLLFADLAERGGVDLRIAFQEGLISIQKAGSHYRFQIDPSLQGTWQANVISLFLQKVHQILRRHPHRSPFH